MDLHKSTNKNESRDWQEEDWLRQQDGDANATRKRLERSNKDWICVIKTWKVCWKDKISKNGIKKMEAKGFHRNLTRKGDLSAQDLLTGRCPCWPTCGTFRSGKLYGVWRQIPLQKMEISPILNPQNPKLSKCPWYPMMSEPGKPRLETPRRLPKSWQSVGFGAGTRGWVGTCFGVRVGSFQEFFHGKPLTLERGLFRAARSPTQLRGTVKSIGWEQSTSQ